jgi:hypothetical protein
VNFLVYCALLHCVSWFSPCCRVPNFLCPPPPNSGRGIRRNAAKNRRRNPRKLRRSCSPRNQQRFPGTLCIFTDFDRIQNSYQPALPACGADSASAARNDLYRTLRNCILAAARTKAGVNSSGCQIRDGESGAFLR